MSLRLPSSSASAQSSDDRLPAGQQQEPRRGRIFSEEDEILLLSELADPSLSPTDLDHIGKSLGSKFTRVQIQRKIRRFRAKYRRQAGTRVLIKTSHDLKVLDLARNLWGNGQQQ